MPYLAFDLDALENCPNIASGCGLQTPQVTHGLLMLWRHCWREKTDRVTTSHLKAFFAGADVVEMLLTFEHIEASEDGWRVRGAAKWLKVQDARSANGKANAGNLKRGSESPGKVPAGPRQPPGSAPALAASSQQPAANSKSLRAEKPPAPKREKAIDPRHAPTVKALCEAVPGYDFDGGKDARQVTLLLAKAEPVEIVTRWRRANERGGFPLVRTLAELVDKWAHFATEAQPSKPAFDFDQGIISSRTQPPPPRRTPPVYVPPEMEIPQ